jgi:acyl carrier protein
MQRLEHALPAERRNLLFEHICGEAAAVLGFDRASELDPEQGLFDLGMDSLTAVELKNRLQTTLGKPLPSTLLFDYPNVQKLTDYVAREVLRWNDGAPIPAVAHAKADPTAHHDEFSEDELADLLARKLHQLQ